MVEQNVQLTSSPSYINWHMFGTSITQELVFAYKKGNKRSFSERPSTELKKQKSDRITNMS
ncbi:hypothetical protein RNJ44_02811 [Nakaseomyces bracarensis]|uniref:Uncharacterized protein n=1 Tax=Nakaseomyces bracarensis TaxID=273131 RepID=A0ABR4P0C4_9SACH